MKKITLKEYKQAVKAYNSVKSATSAKAPLTYLKQLLKQINAYKKQNPNYLEYKQLNNKYSLLRRKINKISKDFTQISNRFGTINNPFNKYTNLTSIKFNGKESIKELKLNIKNLQEVFTENNLKPNSKYNNLNILLNITLTDDNYQALFDSEQWQEIKAEEDLNGGYQNGDGYVSEKRLSYTLENLTELIESNPTLITSNSAQFLKLFEKYSTTNKGINKLYELYEKENKFGMSKKNYLKQLYETIKEEGINIEDAIEAGLYEI